MSGAVIQLHDDGHACHKCGASLIEVVQDGVFVTNDAPLVKLVEVDGRDVTGSCYRVGFDVGGELDGVIREGAGAAYCYLRGEDGRFVVRHGELAREVFEGPICVVYEKGPDNA